MTVTAQRPFNDWYLLFKQVVLVTSFVSSACSDIASRFTVVKLSTLRMSAAGLMQPHLLRAQPPQLQIPRQRTTLSARTRNAAQQVDDSTSIARGSYIEQKHVRFGPIATPGRGCSSCPSSIVCHAAAGGSQPIATTIAANLEQVTAFLDAFYRFSRPHTMLGTFVSIVSVSMMAMQTFAWTPPAVTGLVQALVPALLMNVSIVGINQIYDVEIDKVNKPYLPLASGDLTMQQGVGIVVGTAALSLLLGFLSGSVPLILTLVLSLTLGVLYSIELPFMRWKRSPWLAALCILAVRAVMVQLGFFLHMQQSVAISDFTLTRPLAFTMGFMLLFSVVIALFKDIPDVKGDTQAGVKTFSVRHGISSIYWVCIGLLIAAYGAGVVFGLTSPVGWSRVPVAVGHLGFAALLWDRSKRVNTSRKSELTEHYMFVWKLFYAEYLLIPFLR